MQRTERYKQVIKWFELNMPVAETELNYANAFQLLVAVILSAQCTDKRVNMITPKLFEKLPDAQAMANATIDEIFELIRSCSYPNNKAKHLSAMAKMLINDFNGEVPSDINELQKLPGVGRKTANVVASVHFNIPAIAVDTHVFRVSARLGLTVNAKTPLASETQLKKYIPKDIWAIAHHWLILHGRYVCVARKPKCNTCGLSNYCAYFEQNKNEE
ncbi:MAG: endonuclease III [Salinivirgaceae bacterium]|nr:endonuclease III [Salinivirgaceae bacterium]